MTNTVVVYGGSGALGQSMVHTFKSAQWQCVSVDLSSNAEADTNICLDPQMSMHEAATHVLASLASSKIEKVEALVNVAGGWAGGALADSNSEALFEGCERMWQMCVRSSVVAAHVATQVLKPNGFLLLTGAQAALGGTPGMVGYGIAKAATHQLLQTCADNASGMPENVTSVAILPITLDTPGNRAGMPDADFSTWTPLDTVSQKVFSWCNDNVSRPKSGAMIQVVTEKNETSFLSN